MQTIELDCRPGNPRPGDLIDGVLKGVKIDGKQLKAGDTIGTFFGCWTWGFDIPRDVWEKEVQPIIQPRIEKLYHSGLIRYGSW
jgi:hypothetical protein